MSLQQPQKGFVFSLLMVSLVFTGACSQGTSADTSGNSTNKQTIRVSIGTQDQVINTATGGSIIREEKLLEKHLPKTGKYQNVDYQIEWSSYTSGPPITNKMLANQIDIGLMGDFPATINMTTFQQKGGGVKSIYIATLGYSPTGTGNAVVVPKDSTIKTLADLKGKKALLEANKMFRSQPEAIASKVKQWSGVEQEVVYMFIGPSGLQKLDPTIRQVHFDALKNSVVTLKQLGKLDANVNPEQVNQWADESYLRQAIKETGLNYNDVIAAADQFLISGKDAQTGEPINDPKMAAQVWSESENKVMSFASVENMMTKTIHNSQFTVHN